MQPRRSFQTPFWSSFGEKTCDHFCSLTCSLFLRLFLNRLESDHCLEVEMAYPAMKESKFRRSFKLGRMDGRSKKN